MRPPQPGCAWASSLCGLPRPPRPTLLPYTTLFRSVGLEALDDLARDPLAEQRLDLAEQALLVDADQRDRVAGRPGRSEEHTSELQSRRDLVCRLLLETKYGWTAARCGHAGAHRRRT